MHTFCYASKCWVASLNVDVDPSTKHAKLLETFQPFPNFDEVLTLICTQEVLHQIRSRQFLREHAHVKRPRSEAWLQALDCGGREAVEAPIGRVHDALVRNVAEPPLRNPFLTSLDGACSMLRERVLVPSHVMIEEEHRPALLDSNFQHIISVTAIREAKELLAIGFFPFLSTLPALVHGKECLTAILTIIQVNDHGGRSCHVICGVGVLVQLILFTNTVVSHLKGFSIIIWQACSSVNPLQNMPEMGSVLFLIVRQPNLFVIPHAHLGIVLVLSLLDHLRGLEPAIDLLLQSLAFLVAQHVIHDIDPRMLGDYSPFEAGRRK
mmetsp:Transcript_22465/g.40083  ORF Transcript_22465/g.40083 Transcript_22465/m.40083 type:complete len:323 (-) Transcript_22465:335-1303(-)